MNVFIVPSCIKSLIGKIDLQDRYELTFKTFETIRNKVENAKIIFCDSSIGGLSESQQQALASKVDYYLDFSNDAEAQEYNQMRSKSFGEVYLLKNGIQFAKRELDLNQTGRMFKLGARYVLLDNFTIEDYKNTEGKYVFKKREKSWMDEKIQQEFNSTHMLQTLLYSWSFSLVDDYLNVLKKNMESMKRGFDTEHAHFLNIPKDKLLEFDVLNAGGNVAGYTSAYYVEH